MRKRSTYTAGISDSERISLEICLTHGNPTLRRSTQCIKRCVGDGRIDGFPTVLRSQCVATCHLTCHEGCGGAARDKVGDYPNASFMLRSTCIGCKGEIRSLHNDSSPYALSLLRADNV